MEIGQGCNTAIAQIAAERLRFPVSRVKVAVEKDTDKDPYDWQTVASKGLILSGNATILACDDLLRQAYAVAGQVLRAQPADLDHDADKVFVRHRPQEAVTFAALSIGYAFPNGNGIGGPLIGVGRYIAQGLTNLDKETGQGLPALDWTYGAHGVVVDVDPDTGEFDVLAIASVFDVGKVVNPGSCAGSASAAWSRVWGRRSARATSTTSRAVCSTRRSPTTRSRPRGTSLTGSRAWSWRPPSSTDRSAREGSASTR